MLELFKKKSLTSSSYGVSGREIVLTGLKSVRVTSKSSHTVIVQHRSPQELKKSPRILYV